MPPSITPAVEIATTRFTARSRGSQTGEKPQHEQRPTDDLDGARHPHRDVRERHPVLVEVDGFLHVVGELPDPDQDEGDARDHADDERDPGRDAGAWRERLLHPLVHVSVGALRSRYSSMATADIRLSNIACASADISLVSLARASASEEK